MKEKTKQLIEIRKHSMAHILATAILEIFPEAKLGTGPATNDGFYYDFDLPKAVTPEDLEILEKKMKKIIKENYPFEMQKISIDKALEKFKKANQPLKVELIEKLKEKGEEKVGVYKSGPFVDLCKGPHLESTGEIDTSAFKLTNISGAYWQADENNQQLQRIYGVVFATKKEIKQYLFQQEEAKKRDHRKLGKELDLFTSSSLVGSGLPLFTPKGTVIREEIMNNIGNLQQKLGWERVTTPHITKPELYKISGHWDKFKDELFKVTGKNNAEFVMKPMNCPHHTQIFASSPKSYRDLPIRYAENGIVYRDEQAGELMGLARVRHITQDDGHVFCTPEQIENEIKDIIPIIKDFYNNLEMLTNGNYWVSLSLHDPKTPEKYMINDDGLFLEAEKILEKIAIEQKLPFKKIEGEAAFYGPKLDFQFKDSLGREMQLGTVQLDFSMPKRFELEYTDENGEKKTPVMIHRAIAGSLERFMAVMIEHYAGAFPTWLAPVQAGILPVSEKFSDYASKLNDTLKKSNIRTEIYNQDEGLGKRIAIAAKQRLPYLLIVGEKEEQDKTVTIRQRGTKKQQTLAVDEFVEMIEKKIEKKK